MRILIFSMFILVSALIPLSAQTKVEGTWKTVDEKTGEARSHIEIYQQAGKYFGKIVKLLRRGPETVCEKCSGDLKGRKLVGMVVMSDLVAKGDYWKDGNILDPESGKEYGCSIWFEEGKTDELNVRGKHWTGLYRTQTWYRVQ